MLHNASPIGIVIVGIDQQIKFADTFQSVVTDGELKSYHLWFAAGHDLFQREEIPKRQLVCPDGAHVGQQFGQGPPVIIDVQGSGRRSS